MNGTYRFLCFPVIAILAGGTFMASLASIPGQIGSYHVRIYSEPEVIPVGKARIRIDVTDASGKPVEGAEIRSLIQMPAMNMGEKETAAQPLRGKPGSYIVEAGFAMAGRFEASLSIRGPLGEARGKVFLETGQDTGTPTDENSSFSFQTLLPWVLGAALLAVLSFVLMRMRQTGQSVSPKAFLTRQTVGGLLLILAALGVSRWAIKHWRRPGSMTPIEAQRMDMNTPAPPGVALVTVAEVSHGPVESTVWYPGQVVAYNEQDIVIRSEGWLRGMPVYVGDRVRENDVVALLDISDIQVFSDVQRMHAELRGRKEALDAAQAEVEATRQERIGAEADLASKQSLIAAAAADREFWQQQNARNKTLLDKRAISNEEYQRDFSMAQQASSRLEQAGAEVRSAQAMVRKAEAMVTATEKRLQQMTADVTAAEAAVRSAEARAGYDSPHRSPPRGDAEHGTVEIRAHLAGVVTARPIGLGQHVGPGQSILKIAQTDSIRLQTNVAEADLVRVKPGFRVSVRGRNAGEAPFIARVTSVAPTVDPVTRTGVVEAVAPNRDMRFLPGQYIELDISTGRIEDTVRVPLTALRVHTETGTGALAAGTSNYVWVAETSTGSAEYTVKPVNVETGVSDGKFVQIVSGLELGQKVVTSGLNYLKRGDAVAVAGESERAQ
jgi:RND family efflux transporter MFP subunit